MKKLIPSLSGRKSALVQRLVFILLTGTAILIKTYLLQDWDNILVAGGMYGLFFALLLVPIKITLTPTEVYRVLDRALTQVPIQHSSGVFTGSGQAIYTPLALYRNSQPHRAYIDGALGKTYCSVIINGSDRFLSVRNQQPEEDGAGSPGTYPLA